MCGISAVVGPNGESLEVIKRILHRIRHRGDPDLQAEIHCELGVALGTNRMSIVSESNGSQPIVSRRGSITLAYNGEIYNFRDLARAHSLSYSEVMSKGDGLALVEEIENCGVYAFSRVEGMFAAIWLDRRVSSVFMARDPLGIKPLYYSLSSGRLFAASEIKALALERDVLEIHEVPPGSVIEFPLLEGTIVTASKTMQIFDLESYLDANDWDESVYVPSLRREIEASVQGCCLCEGPVGVYLSGGIDSSGIFALAKQSHGGEVVALTLGDAGSSDRIAAARLVEELGGEIVAGDCPSEASLFESVSDTVRVVESFEPNLVRQSSVQRLIARLAQRKSIRVILCGEGADELFCGYPEFVVGRAHWKAIRYDFLRDLHRTQLQRVDRCSMEVTTEVRVPYLARPIIELALKCGDLRMFLGKDTGLENKACLRRAFGGVLPEWVRLRPKVVLSEGAGLRGNDPVQGMFANLAGSAISDQYASQLMVEFADWSLRNKEDAFYFDLFRGHGYHKATFMKKRVVANQKHST